jgi:hypothetical protein
LKAIKIPFSGIDFYIDFFIGFCLVAFGIGLGKVLVAGGEWGFLELLIRPSPHFWRILGWS